MIKGCNKRVIVMRDTGSDTIEEAFFILKPGAEKGSVKDSNIIKHAQGIIDSHEKNVRFSSLGMNVSSSGHKKKKLPWQFILGLVLGAVIAVMFI